MCWILRDEYGSPGLLHTLDKAKRRGYGSLAAACITKIYGEENKCPHVYIVKNNFASQALFIKLGYQPYDSFKWYTVGPK